MYIYIYVCIYIHTLHFQIGVTSTFCAHRGAPCFKGGSAMMHLTFKRVQGSLDSPNAAALRAHDGAVHFQVGPFYKVTLLKGD